MSNCNSHGTCNVYIYIFFLIGCFCGLWVGAEFGMEKGIYNTKVNAVKAGHAKWEIDDMGERTFIWEPRHE